MGKEKSKSKSDDEKQMKGERKINEPKKNASKEEEDADAKEGTKTRREAYKDRKKAERKKNKKKGEKDDEGGKGKSSEDKSGAAATDADSSGYFSSPESNGVGANHEKESEFSALVSGIQSKLQKIRKDVSVAAPSTEDASESCPTAEASSTIPSPAEAKTKSDDLKAKLNSQLDGAKFRFINEKLYTMTSQKADEMFQADDEAFGIYHRGYAQQVAKWPVNPVDVIIEELKAIEDPKSVVDFGCGEAKLARELKACGVHEVKSFDLVAANELVTACDMRRCPLPDSSVDVAVFCLSLMGTNMVDFIREANRVLKKNGVLKIAEVESRCKNLKQFLRDLQKCGFKLSSKNQEHKVFFLVDLKKVGPCKVSESFPLGLDPCFYKKR